MATSAGESAEIDRPKPEKQKAPAFGTRGAHPSGEAAPLSSRRLIEQRAVVIARNWRARRQLLVRDLHPSVVDSMRAWAQAEARLERFDDRGEPNRQLVAFQNSAARLRRVLEQALEKHPALPSPLSRRYR
jgi:hypothetical protein